MKYFIYLINTCLLVLIPVSVITAKPTSELSLVNRELKKLNSEYVMKVDEVVEEEEIVEEVAVQEDEVVEEKVEKKESYVAPAIPIEDKHADLPQEDLIVEKPKVTTQPENKGLKVYTGAMSGYGPDCYGCSGLVAYKGIDVRNNIYYNDSEYGKVRILAGDKSIPFGTILKIESSSVSTMNAIVLDRGGDIGLGDDKKFLFDLLFDSQASARLFGVSHNTTFTVLREGF